MALSRPAIRASATKSKIVLKPNSSQAWCRTSSSPQFQASLSCSDSAATKLPSLKGLADELAGLRGQRRDIADGAGARALWGTKGPANQVGEVGDAAVLAFGDLHEHTCYIEAHIFINASQILTNLDLLLATFLMEILVSQRFSHFEREVRLVIEHPARVEWQLAKAVKEPDEKAPGVYRFRVEVPSKATSSLPVEEVRMLATTYELGNLSEDQIGLFAKQGTITGEMAEALKKITAQKAVVAKLEEEMENRQKDIERIVEDQGRLRENMKALRGSAEERALLQRYTRQLDEQETQLEALRKKIQDTEAQRDKANHQLENMVGDLQIEATM